MRPVVTDVLWSVGLCSILLITAVSSTRRLKCSSCHLGRGLRWSQATTFGGARIPAKKGRGIWVDFFQLIVKYKAALVRSCVAKR